jgi:hypothetical protein
MRKAVFITIAILAVVLDVTTAALAFLVAWGVQ